MMRAENPADAVAGLGQIDARGRVLFRPQHGRVGIGHRFQEGQPGGDGANPGQVADERGRRRKAAGAGQRVDVGGRQEPESPHRHHQQTGDDAPFVAEPAGQQAGGQRHQKVSQVMRELHPGGLRFAQAQFRLKMLVHHVNHAVANSPEEKQRADQGKGDDQVPAVIHFKHAFFLGVHKSMGLEVVADYEEAVNAHSIDGLGLPPGHGEGNPKNTVSAASNLLPGPQIELIQRGHDQRVPDLTGRDQLRHLRDSGTSRVAKSSA